jgi:chorismate mutase
VTEQSKRAEALLREHRESIDRLDAILIYTLASASSTPRRWAG